MTQKNNAVAEEKLTSVNKGRRRVATERAQVDVNLSKVKTQSFLKDGGKDF
ncbi:hypothetical protein D9M69_586870 [compost metagenome]